MKLNINTQIDIDDLEDSIKDYSESVNGIKFNIFAIHIIDILLYRTTNLGEHEDFVKSIEKLIAKYRKEKWN